MLCRIIMSVHRFCYIVNKSEKFSLVYTEFLLLKCNQSHNIFPNVVEFVTLKINVCVENLYNGSGKALTFSLVCYWCKYKQKHMKKERKLNKIYLCKVYFKIKLIRNDLFPYFL